VLDQPNDSNIDDWIACPSCDHLFDMSVLHDGHKARCSRCNHFLSIYRRESFVRVQAFSLAALVFLVLACTFPFLSFRSSGLESVMTLPQTIVELYLNGMWDLALLVASFIVVIPALLLVLLFVLATGITQGRHGHWLVDVGKLVFTLQNWSMVEVFFIGVLVSLVKISHMATVIIGVSFWAYAAFCIFFILCVSNLDRYQSWKRIGELHG
jgi:paraquat-inducible protein A